MWYISLAATTSQQLRKAAVFAHEDQQAIMTKFIDYLTKVCNKLFENRAHAEQVRQFVINQFPPSDCIPPPSASLIEIFEVITHHLLCDYFHYSPLV